MLNTKAEVGESDFPELVETIVFACPGRGCRPFADPVEAENCGFAEGEAKNAESGVRAMM